MTAIDPVAEALLAGEVVVLPTDTVYGLVALASDPAATARIFAIKERADDVPLAVLCATADQALALAAAPPDPSVVALARRWWPGPLTLVLPRRPDIELQLGEPTTTIGLRVPHHELLQELAARIGPLAATSANRHGQPVAATADEARQALGASVAMVVDGGRLEASSSTVLDATSQPWRVLREGPIAAAAIFATGPDGAG